MDELSPSRQRSYGPLIVSSVAALVLVLGLAFWWANQPTAQRRIVLAGRGTLLLRGVTYGKQDLVLGTPWQRLLYIILPNKSASGCTVLSATEDQALTVWVRPDGRLPLNELYVSTYDDRGSETFAASWAGDLQGEQPLVLRTFPRRFRTVGVRLWRRGDDWEHFTPIAEFSVPNPAPRPYPWWNPPPLPQTQRLGDMDVTVEELTEGADPKEIHLAAGQPVAIPYRLVVRVTRGGKPVTDWAPSNFQFSDATGNTGFGGSTAFTNDNGRIEVLFTGGSWPVENALKVRMEMLRTPTAQFAPTEVWAEQFTVPPAGKVSYPHRRRIVNGVSLELEGIAGPWAKAKEILFTGPDAEPKFWISSPPGSSGDVRKAFQKVVTLDGKPVRADSLGGAGDARISREFYRLVPPLTARTFRVSYTVQKPQVLEFVVPKKRGPKARQ